MSALVAGIDSSTQSCKVVIREADGGALVREGRAAHPDGTEPGAPARARTAARRRPGVTRPATCAGTACHRDG